MDYFSDKRDISTSDRQSADLSCLGVVHAYYAHPRSTQPCIPPGSLNRVPASAGVRAGMSPLPGDPMWHVNPRSGVATLRTAIHLLLTYAGRDHSGKRKASARCLSVCLAHRSSATAAARRLNESPRPAYISTHCPTADTLAAHVQSRVSIEAIKSVARRKESQTDRQPTDSHSVT